MLWTSSFILYFYNDLDFKLYSLLLQCSGLQALFFTFTMLWTSSFILYFYNALDIKLYSLLLQCSGLQALFFTFTMLWTSSFILYFYNALDFKLYSLQCSGCVQSKNGVDLVEVSIFNKSEKMSGQLCG